MKSRALSIVTSLAIIAGTAPASTQAPQPTTVDGLVSAAKRAADTDWPGTFLRLCIVPPPPAAPGTAVAADAAPAGSPTKSVWFAEPAKVADNFHFLGTKIHSAWALVGSGGIIVLDTLFDYATPDAPDPISWTG